MVNYSKTISYVMHYEMFIVFTSKSCLHESHVAKVIRFMELLYLLEGEGHYMNEEYYLFSCGNFNPGTSTRHDHYEVAKHGYIFSVLKV